MATVPSIVCPGCQKSFKGRPDLVGKKIRCPKCQHPFIVPGNPSPQEDFVLTGPKEEEAEDKAAAIMAEPPKKSPFQDDDEGPDNYEVTHTDLSARCPNCANKMESEDAIVCLFCGYNTQTRTWGQTKTVIERQWSDWFWWQFPAYCSLSAVVSKVIGALYYCLVMPYNVKDEWYAFMVDHESTRLWTVIFGLFTVWAEGWVVYWRLIIHPPAPEKTKDYPREASPMLAKLHTFALVGIEAVPVEVEVDTSPGLPKTVLVGLPELAVKESIHRIERALSNLGYDRHNGRTVINLAPADLKKDAACFDLPIALGLLVATNQILPEQIDGFAPMGELALDGTVRPIKGALSMAMSAAGLNIPKVLVPGENAREAAVVDDVAVYGVGSLTEAVGILTGQVDLEPVTSNLDTLFDRLSTYDLDFSDVRGQEFAKRALVVAAAGGHNVLMIGSPGTGMTMLARRIPTILPPLALNESLETTRIYSALGQLPANVPLLARRPFRSPHHTISNAGMVGGGNVPTPGEISLAHHGVLFLDELPELNRYSLEVLRQPLEEGRVTISRALTSTTFPADFMLVAAMNPCPCGYLGDSRHVCQCNPMVIERYMGKISGPLLDRIDLHIEVPSVPFQELSAKADGTPSSTMREQVLQARTIQQERFGKDGPRLNSRMSSRQLRQYCSLDEEGQTLLKNAMDNLGLSARAHDRILRMSRTIADLDGAEHIQPNHLMEAIGYRTLDRKLWAR